jgi:hypothetical protein
MERSPGDDLVARVVAWHNKHPLARRIGAAHVHGLGLVALPFVTDGPAAPVPAASSAAPAAPAASGSGGDAPAPAPASLRERAMQRAGGALPAPAAAASPSAGAAQRPAFSERFLPPFSAARVGAWALQQGVPQSPGPANWPLRQVAVDGRLAAAAAVGTLWVRTAAIDGGARQRRVLIGGGAEPQVLGARLWDLRRCAALGSALGVLVALAMLLPRALAPAPAGVAPAAAAAASAPVAGASAPLPARPRAAVAADTTVAAPGAASVEPAAAAAAPPAAVAAASAAAAASAPVADVAAVATAPAAAAAPTAPAPAPAAATRTSAPRVARAANEREFIARRPDRPHLVGALDDAAKAAARAELNAARAGRGLPPLPERAASGGAAPAPAPAAPGAAPAAGAATGITVWAVSTRSLRTRFESEQMVVALRDAATRAGGSATRVEVLPAGDDFRAVNWPYARREDAERIRALLVARGIRAEVVEF